jgi:hypothetical protein
VPTELTKQNPHSRRGDQLTLAIPVGGWAAPAISEINICSGCEREIISLDRLGRSEFMDREGRCFSCSTAARKAVAR